VEIVEDIRDDVGSRRTGKKANLPWKEVLRRLQKAGCNIHKCPAKLRADYKIAKDYWEAVYGSGEQCSPAAARASGHQATLVAIASEQPDGTWELKVVPCGAGPEEAAVPVRCEKVG
jgi:hypothetical protein